MHMEAQAQAVREVFEKYGLEGILLPVSKRHFIRHVLWRVGFLFYSKLLWPHLLI
jgi:hypothetical protein